MSSRELICTQFMENDAVICPDSLKKKTDWVLYFLVLDGRCVDAVVLTLRTFVPFLWGRLLLPQCFSPKGLWIYVITL